MTSSYRKINYRLRPAKSVERKMLCEAFRKLSNFQPIEKYRYVGFGSTYFSDFYLFHKHLNLQYMLSIEKDTSNKPRFEFNCPFKCIEIHFGNSNEILLTLDWSIPSIIWLDYDGRLDESVFSDIQTVFSEITPGSVVLISVNSKPYEPPDERLDELHRRIDETRIPNNLNKKDLNKWGTASVHRNIINNEIEDVISNRNGGLNNSEKVQYKQLFNFHYKDDAEMLTVGGIIYSSSQKNVFSNCLFNHLDYIRFEKDPYLIQVPNLTYRELRYLDTLLPIDTSCRKNKAGIPEIDINAYSQIYRYFPNFVEGEF